MTKKKLILKLLTIIQWILCGILFLLFWEKILLTLIVLLGCLYLFLAINEKEIVRLIYWYDCKGGRETIMSIKHKICNVVLKIRGK